MDRRAWILFSDKVLGALAADREGIFSDLRPEIERRLFDADPDKEILALKDNEPGEETIAKTTK